MLSVEDGGGEGRGGEGGLNPSGGGGRLAFGGEWGVGEGGENRRRRLKP